MTSILTCTFPGKFGDLLWALPAMRAAAHKLGEPVRLRIPPTLASIAELVERQDYIRSVRVIPEWQVRDTAPVTPWLPPTACGSAGELTIHLGYRKWPTDVLPRYVMGLLQQQWRDAWGDVPALQDLQLDDPWITVERRTGGGLYATLSDEWIELKYGVTAAVAAATGREVTILHARNSRWDEFPEINGLVSFGEGGWLDAAERLASAKLVLGSLSALSVLAAAMGKPRVLFEPNPHAHHFIFRHWDTPLVVGIDGLPTFDARHIAEAVRKKLRELGELDRREVL